MPDPRSPKPTTNTSPGHPDHPSDTPTTQPRPKPSRAGLFHAPTSLTGNDAAIRKISDAQQFYKWITRAESTDGLYTDTDRRRAQLDTAVAAAFKAAKGLHGSPRLIADLRDLGWEVSEKTVADSMRRQGLVARRIKRRNGLTKQDKTAPKFPDLVKRDFTAAAPNRKWVGDMTEIPTESGQKLYLATVIDL
ncbi:MAG TPA: IS3 family transposase, partial [Mycobacterium sp.]|nr:IS3 family transposase [Mycobacterium sp.]